ncbi:MAG: hypothetical protein KDG89_13785 [Geminicoccaceae bacterium]|nr:hypothetical protein [Geminicoccaceae bacterium]
MVDLDRLEAILTAAARERRDVTYGALLASLGFMLGPRNVNALCRDLFRLEERMAGAPELACLVVRKDDGLPGRGYFAGLAAREGLATVPEGDDARAWLRRRQAQAFDWAERLPPEEGL